eukprot:Seg2687.1 transcript_id=Seg2687.1/GoldUCD/mRNA.D3Y31 product="Arginine kinase" protein_id=Seg2687.1/GoldUCD/D3Y31
MAYPSFPVGTTSLLSKCLTPEIWNALKDKEDEVGFPFKKSINSGIVNTDSSIGVYAGSHDSYITFALLMDPVIETFHGFKPDAKHTAMLDPSKLLLPKFEDDELAMINSTRIRVGRNLPGYPLGPAINREQRLDVMNKLIQVFDQFEGDLRGKFYPLENMTKEDQNELIANHFLFKEGDRFQEACGLNRDWPSGRGIFHNDAKTFLVWVNEEDQLRVISMEDGGDIYGVYVRLCNALASMQGSLNFSYDDHRGYITSCPTNLGTAMRASVHIKLPKLSQHKANLERLATKYKLQIRGVHGEHSESEDGTYDVSNARRLGKSENELLKGMAEGIKALIAEEKKLKRKPSDVCHLF